jgi:hypothetical protein
MREVNGLSGTPLAHLPQEQTRPPREALDKVMQELMNN